MALVRMCVMFVPNRLDFRWARLQWKGRKHVLNLCIDGCLSCDVIDVLCVRGCVPNVHVILMVYSDSLGPIAANYNNQ